MNEWKYVALKDIFNIARGGSPRPIDRFITEEPDGVNWIMIGDASASSKYITKTKKRIKKTGVSRSRLVNPGDFLLTNSMSFGHPYIMKISGCIHDGWLVLSPQHADVDQDYFYHLLGSKVVYSEFQRRAAGATVKNLNIDLVKSIEVPLPPIAEQKRIAAILDQAEALRSLRREAIGQLEELGRSVFLEMFGDPVTNPKGWNRVPFGELLTAIESGKSPNCLDRPAMEGEWGVLKLGAVTWCEYNPFENKALPPQEEPETTHEVKVGDLLFTRKNTYELVAACALVRSTPERLLLPDLIFRFRLKPNALIDPCFLHQLLIDPRKRREVQKLASGSASSMPNISKAKLQITPIEVPPLPLQQEFAKRIEAIEALKATQREAIAQLDALFASLQHRAFRGEL